jgi:hypothetical protein
LAALLIEHAVAEQDAHGAPWRNPGEIRRTSKDLPIVATDLE